MWRKIMPTQTLNVKNSHFKHIFKPVGKHIIVHSKGEEKNSKILVPDLGTYRDHRQWNDKENIVYAIGDEVTKVEIGDRILLGEHVKMMRADMITKMVEERLGIKFTIEHRDDKGSIIADEETEKYFCISEDDILTIVN